MSQILGRVCASLLLLAACLAPAPAAAQPLDACSIFSNPHFESGLADWKPFDTPASTADLLVRIFGWTPGAVPTLNNPAADTWSRSISWNPAAQSFDFTGSPDGQWGSRVLTFITPAATTLGYLSISFAGRNNNHDQYIAIDVCDAPTPAQPATWGTIKHRYH